VRFNFNSGGLEWAMALARLPAVVVEPANGKQHALRQDERRGEQQARDAAPAVFPPERSWTHAASYPIRLT
jgi:hypothetical protein